MVKTWERSIINVNPVGEYENIDGIVKELDFLIGVAGNEREVEFGVDPSKGEVEVGQLKRGDAEVGPMRMVDNLENGPGYGYEDKDEMMKRVVQRQQEQQQLRRWRRLLSDWGQ